MVGNVKITQNLEIQGNLTIDGNLFQVAIFKVTKTASQMISNDVLTTVSFDTTDINNSGTPGTWNGTDTFTMTRPGWYNISAAYDYGTSFPNKHLLQIHINNTAVNTLGQGQLYSTGLSAQAQTQTIIHLDVGDTVKVKTHQTSGATATVSSAHLVIHYLPGTTQSAALSQIVSNIVCANVGVRTDLIQAKTSSPFGSITVVDDTQFNGNVVVSGHLRTAGTKLLRTTLQTTSVANTSSYIYNFNTPGELVIFDAFITGQEGNIGVLSGNVAMYSFRDGGVINRGGNITSFITPTKTILIEDDVTFDAAITLVGNGLQIEVTSGDLMPNVNWSIILDLKGEFAT
jgi:hypothetical protein